MSGGEERLFALLSSIPLHFCFLKFPVSLGLFPLGFIHDLHLEIIYVHKNKPSAILRQTLERVCPSAWKGHWGATLLKGVAQDKCLEPMLPPSPLKIRLQCLCGLFKVFDSNAKWVIQCKKPQLLGEIVCQAGHWPKRLTLAQPKNMH